MYYAFIDEAWSPPSFVKSKQAPSPAPSPTPSPAPSPAPTPRAPASSSVLKDMLESLYAQGYRFKNLLELLPTAFQLEAREHFSDDGRHRDGRRNDGDRVLDTNTITTLLLSGVLVLIFYDALSKLFRM